MTGTVVPGARRKTGGHRVAGAGHSSAIVCAVQWAFSPLGFGSTHTRVPPNVRSCGPTRACRSSKAVRYAVTPTTASQRGRRRATLETSSRPPSRYSSAVSSSARALARATTLVIPSPYDGSSPCSEGISSRGVNPERWSTGQNRLPGRAKWWPVTAVIRPGLMPQNSTSRPSATTSGTRRSRAASSSARVKRVRGWLRACSPRPPGAA